MRVLFTSPVLAHPSTNGPQLRIENSIKALAASCELHVIARAVSSGEEQARAAKYFRAYCREFVVAPRLNRAAPTSRVLRRLDAAWRGLAESDSREDAELILDCVDRHGIEIVWFGYGNISYPLMRRIRAVRPRLKLVCDTDSVWSRFVLRELPYAEGWRRKRAIAHAGRRKEREERAWVELCDVTTAVSAVDAEYYRSLTGKHDRVRLFPNVIDLQSYLDRPPRPPDFRNPSICLSGSFGYYHSPMDTAARWVLDKILPLLLRRHPDLHFYIIGSGSEKGFGHLNGSGITVTGRVPSVTLWPMPQSLA
jgi:glycosyltransferase involved in cell wall biosynthesis